MPIQTEYGDKQIFSQHIISQATRGGGGRSLI